MFYVRLLIPIWDTWYKDDDQPKGGQEHQGKKTPSELSFYLASEPKGLQLSLKNPKGYGWIN